MQDKKLPRVSGRRRRDRCEISSAAENNTLTLFTRPYLAEPNGGGKPLSLFLKTLSLSLSFSAGVALLAREKRVGRLQ